MRTNLGFQYSTGRIFKRYFTVGETLSALLAGNIDGPPLALEIGPGKILEPDSE